MFDLEAQDLSHSEAALVEDHYQGPVSGMLGLLCHLFHIVFRQEFLGEESVTVVDGGLDPADLRRICLAVPEPLVELFQRDFVAMLGPVCEFLPLQPCEILLYM